MNTKALMIRSWAPGDLLMAEPFVRALKKKYEKVYVSTLIPDIFKNHPDTECLIDINPEHLGMFDMYCLDNTYEKRLDMGLMVQDSYMLPYDFLHLNEKEKVPKIFLDDEEIAFGEALLGEGKWLAFYLSYPNGPGFRPYWEYSHWRPIIQHLKDQGFKICLIGQGPSAKEKIKCDLIDLDVRGKTSIRQWLAIQSRADLFIGNEGCPVIVAQAFGTPGIGIFNTNIPSSLFMNDKYHNMEIFHHVKGEGLRKKHIIKSLDKIVQNYGK